jgi:hypothetical protein
MDQATLVSPDLQAAHEALAVLEAANIERILALLVIFPEYGEWRLVLSSPSLDQTHPLKAQDKVAEILPGRFVYTLPIIMVLPTKDPFVRGFQRWFRGIFPSLVEAGATVRLGGQTIGGRLVIDGYLVRFPGVTIG